MDKKSKAGVDQKAARKSANKREEMDKKTKACAGNKAAGISSNKRETVPSNSNLLISHLSGDGNYIGNSNINIYQTLGGIKQPKGRAPLRKGDQAPPRKEIGATSDTDKENKPKETTCSKLSTVAKNSDTKYKKIRVMIHDVEEEPSKQKDGNTQLPGVFRVSDSTGWGYLIVSGPVNKKSILKPGKSIEVFNVEVDKHKRRELYCNSQDVRKSSESVKSSISIEDMEEEEKSAKLMTNLNMIKKSHGFQKTKLQICKVVKEKERKFRFGEFIEVTELEVRNDGRQPEKETLEAAANYNYEVGQEVKIRVKYNGEIKKFQTSNHCGVKKLRDL